MMRFTRFAWAVLLSSALPTACDFDTKIKTKALEPKPFLSFEAQLKAPEESKKIKLENFQDMLSALAHSRLPGKDRTNENPSSDADDNCPKDMEEQKIQINNDQLRFEIYADITKCNKELFTAASKIEVYSDIVKSVIYMHCKGRDFSALQGLKSKAFVEKAMDLCRGASEIVALRNDSQETEFKGEVEGRKIHRKIVAYDAYMTSDNKPCRMVLVGDEYVTGHCVKALKTIYLIDRTLDSPSAEEGKESYEYLVEKDFKEKNEKDERPVGGAVTFTINNMTGTAEYYADKSPSYSISNGTLEDQGTYRELYDKHTGPTSPAKIEVHSPQDPPPDGEADAQVANLPMGGNTGGAQSFVYCRPTDTLCLRAPKELASVCERAKASAGNCSTLNNKEPMGLCKVYLKGLPEGDTSELSKVHYNQYFFQGTFWPTIDKAKAACTTFNGIWIPWKDVAAADKT